MPCPSGGSLLFDSSIGSGLNPHLSVSLILRRPDRWMELVAPLGRNLVVAECDAFLVVWISSGIGPDPQPLEVLSCGGRED